MIVTLVHIWVKEGFTEPFISATIENQANTLKEPGNLRFDLLHDAADLNKFVLYEAFISEQANADHKTTAHYLKWRDTVADWMEKPRSGIKHIVISPWDESQW